jgi:hypothetical protein
MKGICFTFDAFGEWLEHYGIKMWWMVKGRGKLSYPILRKRERSLHTCAQDVQITRMATI